MKFGAHCYLPNAKINLRSNFNSEKLVKSETLLLVLLRLGLKGVKYFGMSQNFACTLVYQMGIQIYDQISIITNCSKVKLCHVFSLGLGLKVVKIVGTLWKLACMLVYLMGIEIYDQVSILRSFDSNFNSKKVDNSAYFQPWFDHPWLRAKIAPNLIKIGVNAYIWNGYLNLL